MTGIIETGISDHFPNFIVNDDVSHDNNKDLQTNHQ